MAKQECYQEKLQMLKAEKRLIVADQGAAALSRCFEREKEDTKHKIEGEQIETAQVSKRTV